MHPTDERREANSHDIRERWQDEDRCTPAAPTKAQWRVLAQMQTSDRVFHARLARAWMLADDREQFLLMQAFGREYRKYHDALYYGPPSGPKSGADACGPADTPVGGLLDTDGSGGRDAR